MNDQDRERFVALTQEAPDGCVVWKRGESKFYPGFKLDRKVIMAHRAAWILFVGPIPPGLFVCHHCDNMRCVAIPHLFLGTHSDNMRDMVSKGRHGKVKPCGEQNANSKLTADHVRAIRAGGASNAEFGRRFGVARQTVRAIRIGAAWRGVK